MSDFTYIIEPTIVILTPITERAKAWTEEHIEDGMRWAADGRAIEPRFFPPIAEGIVRAGMTVAPA